MEMALPKKERYERTETLPTAKEDRVEIFCFAHLPKEKGCKKKSIKCNRRYFMLCFIQLGPP